MATKKSPRYKLVTVPLYDKPVHVVEGSTMADAATEARRRWPDLEVSTKDVEQAYGFCTTSATHDPVILLPVGASPGCVAHECLHAANFVLQNVGIKANTDNDEQVSYVLQFIVDAVAPWLTSRRRTAQAAPTAPAKSTAALAPAPAVTRDE